MRPISRLGENICAELLKYFSEFEIISVVMFIGVLIIIWRVL